MSESRSRPPAVPGLLRVAYLCEFPTLLGGERSLLVFLEHAREVSIEPLVVAPGPGLLAEALARRGIERVDWPAGGRQAAARLVPLLGKHDPHLVHANSLMTADAAAALSRELSVPGVAHVRDILGISTARRNRFAGLDHGIAVSEAVRSWLLGLGVPGERLSKIPNAVDADRLRKEVAAGSLRRELGLDRDTRLVGCIGQIALRKGQDVFLEAAAQLALESPRTQFVIAGARYSQKEESRLFEAGLRARAAEAPLAGKVHFLGYREDIASVLSDLDLVGVPSRQEPLSRVLLEALALGVPAVATDVGGSAEILGGSGAGWLVPADDPVALARAIEALLESEEERRAMSRRGPTRARAFSPGAQLEAIRGVYDRVLRQRT
jgi:glycosyltransferase involved in cell wall biosynthesis